MFPSIAEAYHANPLELAVPSRAFTRRMLSAVEMGGGGSVAVLVGDVATDKGAVVLGAREVGGEV